MFKKLLLTSFLTFTIIGIIYPTEKENTKIFDYCFSLEKILLRNSIQNKENLSNTFKAISKDITKVGLNNSRGALIKNSIDNYKKSQKRSIFSLIPNEIFCFAGYWIEKLKPGTIEEKIYKESQKRINKFKNFKNEVDGFINDLNSKYKFLKKD